MQLCREEILEKLYAQLHHGRHIIGVSCGCGLSARHVQRGGVDLILALNSARFRQMGQGSLAGFMPYTNSNRLVMQFGMQELIPSARKIPVLFGLCATDPTILPELYIRQIQKSGFTGLNNYPTVGLIDGRFREALEEQGISYALEVEAIRLAHELDLFTLAFVFSPAQALQMLDAGADAICVHLGLTKGGLLGAKKAISLQAGVRFAQEVFEVCAQTQPQVIRLVYGGPVHTPADLEYIYQNTTAQGYIGGSAFDRMPTEQAISDRARDFKAAGQFEQDMLLQKMLAGIEKHYDYVRFVQEYVSANYMNEICFSDLAQVAHITRSHLSALFHKQVGCTFPQYLAQFRINKACEIIKRERAPFLQVSELVGFKDYAHFCRVFRKITGQTPSQFSESVKKGLL